MKKFVEWLENKLAPKMEKVNDNIWIQTLKDSMLQLLPLILVGSLVTIFAILQDFIPNFPNLWSINSYTMGLLGVLVAFLVPLNYMERKRLRRLRFVAGITGFAMFAIIVHLSDLELFDFASMGAGGMFAALIVGILAGTVFSLFGKFSFFKEDSAVPDFVRQWFDCMLPMSILVFGTWLLVNIVGLDIFALILLFFSPLGNFAQSLVGFTLFYFISCFFYTMGISTWVIFPLRNPIMLAGIAANTALVAQGLAPTNIHTLETVFMGWLAIGGTGGTIFLVLFMLFSKSNRLKALAKASLAPSLLNINEPIVFGAVVWNPIMMIPMWIHGLIVPIITYLWLKAGLATIPSEVFAFWYCPYPISTWLVSRSIGGMILLAIMCVVNVIIYYPFFKVYEHQQMKLEGVSTEAGKQES